MQIDHSNPRLIELLIRRSYGRLLAMLSVRSGDVASAEDALATAFETALKNWPDQGIPSNPEAWLFTVARRQLIDQLRSAQTQQRHQEAFSYLLDETSTEGDPLAIPDQRLALMFACTHPAIDRNIRAPLMLQTLLGFDAASIASAFLVAPSSMAQRLVRAKNKIRLAGMRLIIPDQNDISHGLEAVLDAIYAIYTAAWLQTSDGDIQHGNLAEEALWLAQLLSELAPQEPEIFGLLALMLYAESRRTARQDAQGKYVPLQEQDCQLWDHDKIDRAENFLRHASNMQRSGRFQIEAAIQSAHSVRRVQGKADWHAINKLYCQLYQLTDSPVVAINYAVALAEIIEPQIALAQLEQLCDNSTSKERINAYQPYWAACAHLHQRCGNMDAAKHAYQLAIGLCTDQAARGYLQGRLKQMDSIL